MEFVEGMNRRYVRIRLQEGLSDGMEGYRSRIILKNKIALFVKADKRHIDGASYFYYDISGLHNLKQVVSVEPVTIEKMNCFVDFLEKVLNGVEEYLLLQKELCLNPEYILYDEKSEEWRLLYIPGYGGNTIEDIDSLLETIMERVDCTSEDDKERFYSFYNDVLQNMDEMTLDEIVRLWDKGAFKQEKKKVTEAERTQQVCAQPLYKGRIYTVPYHGIMADCQYDGTLT